MICDRCGQRLPFDIAIEHYCPSPVSGTEHEAPPPGKFVSIAANKAMAAPVSGTEPLDLAIERLRETGQEDAASFLDEERDAVEAGPDGR